ncbi:hypothetical protein BCIN_10g01900 [Botrytis cinerea B05.10]|uniref:DUF1990 domain-containing protein n=1 Tax=Botryotinia fuckeliana (strain B05.10) TaxID=332648 RepID=A0A384JUJ8_BOTFB|nr:hypothetical protein BCIN_10g01900 [Botrytis cinerea B05.10]ATZ54171.1 hypothetical protein BCIN_10g01900 [Botrytis cinerea B05.10]
MPLSMLSVSKLLVPTTVAGLGMILYLQDHPLSTAKTATITSYQQLSPSFARSSQSFSSIINPRNHINIADSYKIWLSKADIRNRSDEEILATFTHGFFAGWVFTPERYLIASLRSLGMKFIPCGYSRMSPGPILELESLSDKTLPPKGSLLFGGNFMVLFTKTDGDTRRNSPSCVEIGYGDDRKQFSGMHSFELIHERDGAIIWYSSVSCNPTVNKRPFPDWVFTFHRWYARTLFRDGVAAILATE